MPNSVQDLAWALQAARTSAQGHFVNIGISKLLKPVKKNYVIFDPKNIDIMEGPGKNALFKPGYPK